MARQDCTPAQNSNLSKISKIPVFLIFLKTGRYFWKVLNRPLVFSVPAENSTISKISKISKISGFPKTSRTGIQNFQKYQKYRERFKNTGIFDIFDIFESRRRLDL